MLCAIITWLLPVASALPDGVSRIIFDNIKTQKNLVYTPEEELQHFSRFERELQAKDVPLSSNELAELYEDTRPAIVQSLVDEINSKQNLWTASTDQERFYGRLKLCGTLLEEAEGLEEKVYPPGELAAIPSSFDARDAFKECKGVIGHVWDQSACGSCWAIAPVEAFNARLCIKSGGKFNQLLSAGEMLACCNS
ncbi:cathepsin b, putative, partial [Perkinsus marinus ATCC 50983]